MSKPAVLGLWGSRTRFDELQSTHAFKNEIVHFVVRFPSQPGASLMQS